MNLNSDASIDAAYFSPLQEDYALERLEQASARGSQHAPGYRDSRHISLLNLRKAQIASGTYRVDSMRLAECILRNETHFCTPRSH